MYTIWNAGIKSTQVLLPGSHICKIFDSMKFHSFFTLVKNGCDFTWAKLVQLCLKRRSTLTFSALFNIGSNSISTNIE